VKKIRTMIKFIFDVLFPPYCLGCKKEGSWRWLCDDCFSTIEILEYQYCPFCKIRLRTFERRCQLHSKKNLNGLYFATSYENLLVKNLIQKFKYPPFLKELSPSLASLIIVHFILLGKEKISKIFSNSVFIPVPLFKSREKWRGFNQAEKIAKILSEFFKVPLLENNLIKIKKTQPQVELSKEKREGNIKEAFIIKNENLIKGKKIFLIDDVFTTGSTMEECARILKKAGTKEVFGITVARE